MLRLFVGLSLPPDLTEQIQPMLRGLDPARFVEPGDLHLTLRFLGEIPEDQAEEVFYGLDGLRAASFDLEFRGLGTFGGKNPSHLWLGVEPNAALTALQAKIETLCQRAGLAPEPRRFSPHVTLSKLGRGCDLGPYLSLHEPVNLGWHHFGHFSLFRSHLGRTHASYAELEQFPLIGGAG